jgi:hypothetical protein
MWEKAGRGHINRTSLSGMGFRKSNTVTTRVFIDVIEFPKV